MTASDAPEGALRRALSHPRALLIAYALAASILGVHFARYVTAPIKEIDEAAVVYSTGYLGLPPGHERWRAVDAIDHPPAWKYLHGLALLAAGRELGSLEQKDLWLDWAWNSDDFDAFRAHLAATVPTRDLVPGRTLSFLAILGAFAVFAWLFARAFSVPVASIALVLFALQLPVKWVAVRALIDGLLLLAIAGTTALTALYVERGPARGGRGLPWALALGVAIGVATQTKITGVVAFAGAGLAALIWARDLERLRLVVPGVALAGLVAALVGVALNPALWSDPVGVARAMLVHRGEQLELQMLFSTMKGHIPFSEGLRRFVERLVCWPDPIFKLAYVPLVGWLSFLGASRAFVGLRGASPARIAILAHLSLWLLATALTFRLNWMRYLLPALPIAVLVLSCGIAAIVESPRVALSRASAGAIALAAALALFGSRDFAESPEEERARRGAGIALIDRELKRPELGPHKRTALERRREVLLR